MALLGLFILTAMAILFAGVFVIGNQQRMFTHSYRLRAEFPTVSGLLSGAEVRLGGVRKGTVDEIRLPDRPGGKVLVTLSLDSSTRNLVKQDSMAAIETEGLLGNKYLAVSFGSPEAPGVKDWDTIASQAPLDISDLFKKTSAIMDTTQSTMKHFETTSEHIATITARVDHGDGTIGALLKERALYNQLTAATTDIAATSGEARKTVAQARIGVTAFTENMEALKQNILFRGYFKDRGYLDAADLTKWDIGEMPMAAPLKTFHFSAEDLFEKSGTAKLKDKKHLDEVGAYLEAHPFSLVIVQAFSSQAGGHEENLVLTQAQAMVLRNYLAEKFKLDDTKLRTMGMGEVKTTQPDRTSRIEISVYAPATELPLGKTAASATPREPQPSK
jgi:phospholipid/cholesterol/gamma-HCH transport system substrate-binding protein